MSNYCKAFFLTFVFAALSAAATFRVTVDTSSLGPAASGFLDFQFNGSGLPTPAGTATVTDFSGINFNVDDSSASVFGDVSGNLIPGPLSINNTDAFNDYFVPFLGGGPASGFSFLLTLSGDILTPDAANLSGTAFGLMIYDTDGFTPLLTPDSLLALIDIDAAGLITPVAYGPTTVSSVPEPSTILLTAGGLFALASRTLRKRLRAYHFVA